MITIIVSKSLLNIRKKESAGLISGLKKIKEFGFEIILDGFSKKEYGLIDTILKSENISISKSPSFDRVIHVVTRKDNNIKNEQITINARSKIKSFDDAVNEIIKLYRTAKIHRKTKETEIKITVSLDGKGKSMIKTGIGFFDHMLEQIARHGNILLNIEVKGDLEIDEHHTVEDTGIALGEALLGALGNKKGIKRYGYFLPMDDSVTKCAVDLGGRTYLNFNCEFSREYVGEFPTELTEEFFRGLASGLKANIYIEVAGRNDHHKIENIFKAFAKSFNEACRFDERTQGSLPSTKGML